MFGKRRAAIKRAASEREPVDPGRFGDPVAKATEWGPAQAGGMNFCTRKLVAVDETRLEFRASGRAQLLSAGFLLVGLSAVVDFARRAAPGALGPQELIGILFGCVCMVGGGVSGYRGRVPIVFNRRKGYFWKGWRSPDEVFDKGRIRHFAPLDDIHAIQLLAEYCPGKRPYFSYELNVVLKDGRRIHVVDHGDETRLREDAELLAAFLDKPIWDAI